MERIVRKSYIALCNAWSELATMVCPKVSVVIPAYNSQNSVCKSVESAARQSPPPHELIVVDSGPDEQTRIIEELAEEYPSVVILPMPPKGISAARNYGVRMATGDIIVFLDADDFLVENYMAEMGQLASENSGKVLAASLTYTSITSGRTVGYIECVPNERRSLQHAEHIMAFSSGLWAARELLLDHGHFDENLSTGEDGGTIEQISKIAGFRGTSKVLVQNGISPSGLTNDNPLKKDLFLELSYLNNERRKVGNSTIPTDIFAQLYDIVEKYLRRRKDLEAMARRNGRLAVVYYLDRKYLSMIKHSAIAFYYRPMWIINRLQQKLLDSRFSSW